MHSFTVTESIIHYDPELRESVAYGGTWPHSNHFGFVEAATAAHYIQRGYNVLREFCTTSREVRHGGLAYHSTQLLHDIVGPEVSEYFTTEVAEVCRNGSGEPDLFMFRAFNPNDPKVSYPEGPSWFFAEVKGPRDVVRENQKLFWRRLVSRPDLGLGPDRLVLVRAVPVGASVTPATIDY